MKEKERKEKLTRKKKEYCIKFLWGYDYKVYMKHELFSCLRLRSHPQDISLYANIPKLEKTPAFEKLLVPSMLDKESFTCVNVGNCCCPVRGFVLTRHAQLVLSVDSFSGTFFGEYIKKDYSDKILFNIFNDYI